MSIVVYGKATTIFTTNEASFALTIGCFVQYYLASAFMTKIAMEPIGYFAFNGIVSSRPVSDSCHDSCRSWRLD